MRSSVAALAASLTAVVVLLAGCDETDAATGDETPSTAPTGTASESPGDELVGLTWGDGSTVPTSIIQPEEAAEAAQPSDYAVVVQTPTPSADGDYVRALGVLDALSLAVALVPGGAYEGGEWLSSGSQVGSWDGREFNAFADTQSLAPSAHPRQVIASDSDDGTLAWLETDSTNLYTLDWWAFARDTDGRVRSLGSSGEIVGSLGLPIGSGEPTITVAEGQVLVSTSYPVSDGGGAEFTQRLVSRPIQGGEPWVPGQFDVAHVTVAGGNVWTVSSAPEESTRVTADDGRALVVPQGPIHGIDGDGRLLAIAAADMMWVIDLDAGRGLELPLEAPAASAPPAVCGDVVTWTSASYDGDTLAPQAAFVLDARASQLWRIPVDGIYPGSRCGEDAVVWWSIDPDGPMPRATSTMAAWSPER